MTFVTNQTARAVMSKHSSHLFFRGVRLITKATSISGRSVLNWEHSRYFCLLANCVQSLFRNGDQCKRSRFLMHEAWTFCRKLFEKVSWLVRSLPMPHRKKETRKNIFCHVCTDFNILKISQKNKIAKKQTAVVRKRGKKFLAKDVQNCGNMWREAQQSLNDGQPYPLQQWF